MKIKIFNGVNIKTIENEVNQWMLTEGIRPGEILFINQSECETNLTLTYHYISYKIDG